MTHRNFKRVLCAAVGLCVLASSHSAGSYDQFPHVTKGFRYHNPRGHTRMIGDEFNAGQRQPVEAGMSTRLDEASLTNSSGAPPMHTSDHPEVFSFDEPFATANAQVPVVNLGPPRSNDSFTHSIEHNLTKTTMVYRSGGNENTHFELPSQQQEPRQHRFRLDYIKQAEAPFLPYTPLTPDQASAASDTNAAGGAGEASSASGLLQTASDGLIVSEELISECQMSSGQFAQVPVHQNQDFALPTKPMCKMVEYHTVAPDKDMLKLLPKPHGSVDFKDVISAADLIKSKFVSLADEYPVKIGEVSLRDKAPSIALLEAVSTGVPLSAIAAYMLCEPDADPFEDGDTFPTALEQAIEDQRTAVVVYFLRIYRALVASDGQRSLQAIVRSAVVPAYAAAHALPDKSSDCAQLAGAAAIVIGKAAALYPNSIDIQRLKNVLSDLDESHNTQATQFASHGKAGSRLGHKDSAASQMDLKSGRRDAEYVSGKAQKSVRFITHEPHTMHLPPVIRVRTDRKKAAATAYTSLSPGFAAFPLVSSVRSALWRGDVLILHALLASGMLDPVPLSALLPVGMTSAHPACGDVVARMLAEATPFALSYFMTSLPRGHAMRGAVGAELESRLADGFPFSAVKYDSSAQHVRAYEEMHPACVARALCARYAAEWGLADRADALDEAMQQVVRQKYHYDQLFALGSANQRNDEQLDSTSEKPKHHSLNDLPRVPRTQPQEIGDRASERRVHPPISKSFSFSAQSEGVHGTQSLPPPTFQRLYGDHFGEESIGYMMERAALVEDALDTSFGRERDRYYAPSIESVVSALPDAAQMGRELMHEARLVRAVLRAGAGYSHFMNTAVQLTKEALLAHMVVLGRPVHRIVAYALREQASPLAAGIGGAFAIPGAFEAAVATGRLDLAKTLVAIHNAVSFGGPQSPRPAAEGVDGRAKKTLRRTRSREGGLLLSDKTVKYLRASGDAATLAELRHDQMLPNEAAACAVSVEPPMLEARSFHAAVVDATRVLLPLVTRQTLSERLKAPCADGVLWQMLSDELQRRTAQRMGAQGKDGGMRSLNASYEGGPGPGAGAAVSERPTRKKSESHSGACTWVHAGLSVSGEAADERPAGASRCKGRKHVTAPVYSVHH